MTGERREHYRQLAGERLERAGLIVRPEELAGMELADFGLGRFEEIGAAVLVYLNTARCCAKEIVLLPGQLVPEHCHPALPDGGPGKEETFRCRAGEVWLYLPGAPVPRPLAQVPADHREHFTVWRELVLRPGDQHTLDPDTRHWFQAGPQGAVVSEFSTTSRDELDLFTDPGVRRV